MISTDDLRFFATVATASSLAAAARALDVSPPAVTQRLRGLEERLGLRLVDRSARRLALTDEGALLAERGRAILADMAELDDALAARRGTVAGRLRVRAPLGFGRRHVAPAVAAFCAAHPEAAVELTLADRPDPAPADSWDLTVHIGDLRDTALTLRQLAPNERLLCAAPGYVARHGGPERPEDLHGHRCIALRENEEDVTLWRFRDRAGGAAAAVRIEPWLASNDGDVVKGWALDALGVIVRSEWDVADDLRAGRLVRLLPGYRLPAAPVVALLGPGRRARAPRTQRFLDMLAARLTPAPWRAACTGG